MPPLRLLPRLLPFALLLSALVASAQPRSEERARIRAELAARPGQWVSAERWVPERPGLQRCRETGDLQVRQLGRALVVRCAIPERRDGQAGFRIRELIRQAPALDAGAKHGDQDVRAKQSFQEVVKLAREKFVRQKPALPELFGNAMGEVGRTVATDKVGLYRAAMNGLATGLGDRWTRFFEPTKAKEWSAHLQPVQVSCGITLREEPGGGLCVATILGGSPARRAGVRVGDRLLSLEGQAPGSIGEASARLKGEAGTTVRLEFARGEERKLVDLPRQEQKVLDILGGISKAGIGYVKLPKFYDGSARELGEALTRLERRRPLRGLVIDLRGNGGGSRVEWVAMLRQFVRDGSLGENRGQGGVLLERFRADGAARYPELPLAILVDGGSASASERLAAVLKDRGRALIIGAPTYGKDVGQTSHDLPDGSMFKVTDVMFQLPSGGRPGVIQPDVSTDEARRIASALRPGRPIKDPELIYALDRLAR